MADLIDLIVSHANPASEAALRREIEAHNAALRASAGRGNVKWVGVAEAAVRADPAAAIAFDAAGVGTLTAGGQSWCAGRFSAPTLAELRARCAARRAASAAGGRARLWV